MASPTVRTAKWLVSQAQILKRRQIFDRNYFIMPYTVQKYLNKIYLTPDAKS